MPSRLNSDQISTQLSCPFFEHQNTKMVKRIFACSGDRLPDGKIVPENCYYVIGDNASKSYDSRNWKKPFINKENIVAIHIFDFN